MSYARTYLLGIFPVQPRNGCATVIPLENKTPVAEELQWRDGFWTYRRWVRALIQLGILEMRVEHEGEPTM